MPGRGGAAAAGAEGASVVEAGGAVRRQGGRSEAGGNRERRGEWRKKGRDLNTRSLWHRVITSTGTYEILRYRLQFHPVP